jgi:hypothetical protein
MKSWPICSPDGDAGLELHAGQRPGCGRAAVRARDRGPLPPTSKRDCEAATGLCRKEFDRVLTDAVSDLPSRRKRAPRRTLGSLEFISLLSAARIVMAGSGGVSGGSAFLRVPCLTLRDSTERPVTISHGTNLLVGSRPVDLARHTFDTLARHAAATPPRPPLSDGHASERIVEVLHRFI